MYRVRIEKRKDLKCFSITIDGKNVSAADATKILTGVSFCETYGIFKMNGEVRFETGPFSKKFQFLPFSLESTMASISDQIIRRIKAVRRWKSEVERSVNIVTLRIPEDIKILEWKEK